MPRVDREALAANLRRIYAQLCALRDSWHSEPAETRDEGLACISRALELNEEAARVIMGPRFRFEPDLARTTDATPARMSALRPVAPAPSKPALAVIPGGAQPDERPSARYIDDSADDAPQAG